MIRQSFKRLKNGSKTGGHKGDIVFKGHFQSQTPSQYQGGVFLLNYRLLLPWAVAHMCYFSVMCGAWCAAIKQKGQHNAIAHSIRLGAAAECRAADNLANERRGRTSAGVDHSRVSALGPGVYSSMA